MRALRLSGFLVIIADFFPKTVISRNPPYCRCWKHVHLDTNVGAGESYAQSLVLLVWPPRLARTNSLQ